MKKNDHFGVCYLKLLGIDAICFQAEGREMENSIFMFMYSKDFSYGHSLQLLLDQSLLSPLPN